MINYYSDLYTVEVSHIGGFFSNWVEAPSKLDLYQAMRKADKVVIAKDGLQVIGIALSCVLKSNKYCYFLEVHPEYRNKGIGRSLVSRILS